MTKARKLHHIRISTDDLRKLAKHKVMRVDKYLIRVNDCDIPQVKIYGDVQG